MKLILMLAVLTLAGCASSGQFLAGQKFAMTAAGKLADEQMAVAHFNLCNVPTVGAWMRAYGSDIARANAWRTLCATPVTQSPSNGQ